MPALIEATLKNASPLIGQACVIGDRRPHSVGDQTGLTSPPQERRIRIFATTSAPPRTSLTLMTRPVTPW